MNGAFSEQDFHWPVRVYIEDTDAGGIVFYANYLKFFERARTEWVRQQDISLRAGLEDGVSYVVHSLNLRYHAPARLDDELWVTATPVRLGRTWMLFEQAAWRRDPSGGDPVLLVTAEVKVACVSLPEGRPRALPSELAGRLREAVESLN